MTRSFSFAISVLLAAAASLFAEPMATARKRAANSVHTSRGRVSCFMVLGVRLTLVMLIVLYY
jgi:hypothetical protein